LAVVACRVTTVAMMVTFVESKDIRSSACRGRTMSIKPSSPSAASSSPGTISKRRRECVETRSNLKIMAPRPDNPWGISPLRAWSWDAKAATYRRATQRMRCRSVTCSSEVNAMLDRPIIPNGHVGIGQFDRTAAARTL
jgi:hypothetical protein